MNTLLLFFIQLIFRLLPDTKFFGFKRWALRLAGAKIGKNVRICSSVRFLGDKQLSIGDNTWVGHGTWFFCSAPIRIGSNVNIAPLCYVGTGTHQIDVFGESTAGEGVSLPINVEDGVWICARATVLAGTTVGKKSILAAGSVVKGQVPANTIYGGVPATMIKRIDE